MNRIIKHALWLWAVALVCSPAHAADCQAEKHTAGQCTFEIPALKNNEKKQLLVDGPVWSGQLSAQCLSGKTQYNQIKCAPSDKSSCAVGDSVWGGACRHDAATQPLLHGEQVRIPAIDAVGHVDYKCDAGKLKIESLSCSGASPVSAGTAPALAVAQNVQTRDVSIPVVLILQKPMAQFPESYVLSRAEEVCSDVVGYTAGTVSISDISYKSDNGSNWHSYSVACKTQVALRCDEEFLLRQIPGDYGPRGEFSELPSYKSLLRTCNGQSWYQPVQGKYSSVTTIYLGRGGDGNTIDDFTAALVCRGDTKSSRCGVTPPATGTPQIMEAKSCDEAVVYHPAITEDAATLSVTSDSVLTHVCKPLSFNQLVSFRVGNVVNASASPRQYEIYANCAGYNGTAPLRSDCNGETISTGPKLTNKTSCSTATISGTLLGDTDPLTNKKTQQPSASTVQKEFCQASGYATIDNVSVAQSGASSSAYTLFDVTAQCSGAYDTSNCNESDPCRGAAIATDDPRPKLCESGTCYLNTCAPGVQPPADLCKNCDPTTLSFTDPATGNTCSVQTPAALSGSTTNFDFSNGTHSGKAELFCNNGKSKINGGTCFKNCPSGVSLGWNDKNGASSCSQQVPAGTYIHGQTLNFSQSVTNTGSSSWRCDNGTWTNTGGECQLDCKSAINWGSGTSAGGSSKNNVCGGTPSTTKHGFAFNVSSSAANTSGSASGVCQDGSFNVSNESCHVGCPSKSVSWGGACQSTLSGSSHGSNQSIGHTSNSGHPYAWSISGSAAYSCSDGAWSGSGSCEYVVGESAGNWSTYQNSGAPYNCSAWSPSASTVDYGQNFTQSRNCSQNQTGQRTLYYHWFSGKTTVKGTESRTQTISVTETNPATGTKDVVVTSRMGAWSSWSNVGGPYGCGGWSPLPQDVDEGVSFTAYASCSQDQQRSRAEYLVYASGREVQVGTEQDYRTITVTQSKSDTGERPVKTLQWVPTGSSGYCTEPNSPDLGACTVKGAKTSVSGSAACLQGNINYAAHYTCM